jgi:flavodoxin I
MAKIGIFYGSSTGHTEIIAEKIQRLFGNETADVYNVDSASKDDIIRYPYLIFGTPTWGIGDMQDDWEDFIKVVKDTNLDGKKVALFGLGDQDTYPDSFADGVGILYDNVKDKAKVVGQWPTSGYFFEDSEALRDEKFVGLVIDQDNQSRLTDERLTTWVDQLKKEFT